MSKNTVLRISSAIVLVTIVFTCIYLGTSATIAFLGLAGVLVLDEVTVNLFGLKRFSLLYLINQSIFIFPYIALGLLGRSPQIVAVINQLGLLLNFGLIFYLVYPEIQSKVLTRLSKRLPFIFGIYILIPFIILTDFLYLVMWKEVLALLLIVNFGMDTGAWFVGKSIGKHKLWEKVSPKKTIEGLIGGMVFAGLLGGVSLQLLFDKMSIQYYLLFTVLGLISQLGDLVQSKIKRECEIKDSSSLIPGHGGVYDRLDSLMFLTPFFAISFKYLFLGNS